MFTMKHVLQTGVGYDNEIMKRADFNFGYDGSVFNTALAISKLMYDGKNNFVIGGKVTPYISGGMNVSIAPLMAYHYLTQNFVVETKITEPVSFEEADEQYSRIDIIEIKGTEKFFDSQTRAYKDPESGVKTFAATDTKKAIELEVKVKKGSRGSNVAPVVDTGYVKLAEVIIPAGTLNIVESNIFNITSRYQDKENEEWTVNKTSTFNPESISFLMKTFCLGHNDDGTHKPGSINRDALAVGTGADELNGTNIPIGVSLDLGQEHYQSTEVFSTLLKQLGDWANNARPYANNILNRYERLQDMPKACSTQVVDVITGGEMIIDGIHCRIGDMVFLKDQTDKRENGMWQVESGRWTRYPGYTESDADCFIYKFVVINNGEDNGGSVFYLEDDTCTIGKDELHFAKVTLFEQAVNKQLVFTDKKVLSADWSNSTVNAEYPFEVAIECDSVTDAYSADVRLDIDTVLNTECAAVTATGKGKVILYAAAKPGFDFVVPVIICTKVA